MIHLSLGPTLRPFYSQLIKDVKPFSCGKELVCFAMQWGKLFPTRRNDGLLFVGRATNGWTSLTPDVDVLFGNTDMAIFNLPDQMEWVNATDHSKQGYNSRKSAFWRTIRNVSHYFYPENELSHVAWSNVCKVAPYEGNPSDGLYYAQLETCQKILEAEIEELSPRFVIFLTGLGWCKDYIEYLIPEGNRKCIEVVAWGNYQVSVYSNNCIYYLVTEHPQAKPEMEHYQALINIIERYR